MSTSRRRPGRPAGFDRAEALDALLMLFWQRGYEGATQEAMLAATGLSSSSLYRTFGTKARTYEAVLQRYLEVSDGMLGPLEQGTGLPAFLDRLEGHLGGDNGSAGCLVVAAIQDPVNQDARVATLTSRHLDRMRRAIGDDAIYAAVLGILAIARTGDRATTLALIDAVRRTRTAAPA